MALQRRKPPRWALRLIHQWNRLSRAAALLVLVSAISLLSSLVTVLIWMFQHAQCTSRELGVVWTEGAAHTLRRPCPPPPYPTMSSSLLLRPNICITTLTASSSSPWRKCRDFDTVQEQTWPSRQAYAAKHGYVLVDGSHLLDRSRPPAWSKIRAVQNLLDNNRKCDWVFWMDADTVIMNSSIALESLLPSSSDSAIDLIATYDRRFGVNSGSWLLRNSTWSRQFLEDWWNMKAWVRPAGLSLSGDNAAFGHLVQERLENPSDAEHIAVPARCNFNAFGVFVNSAQQLRGDVQQQEWYLSENFYHAGDFVAHASGIDQKEAGVALLLQRAT